MNTAGSINNDQPLEYRAQALKAKLDIWFTEQSFEELKRLLLSENFNTRAVESNRIVCALRSFLEDQRNEHLLPKGKVFYRARFVKPPYRGKGDSFIVHNSDTILEHTTISGYDEENSKEPSLGHSSSQRASMKNASYLYLAEDSYTACSEIKTPQRSVISVARFEALKDLRVIDFFDWKQNAGSFTEESNEMKYRIITGLIAFAFSVPIIDEKEYYVTQYIADLIRKYGVDGIVYTSFYSNKQNYVMFNCAPNAIKFIDSELVIHYSQKSRFFRINDLSDLEYEEDPLIDKTKRDIKSDLLSEFQRLK